MTTGVLEAPEEVKKPEEVPNPEEVKIASPSELADYIEKGRANYPNVLHITGEYLRYDEEDNVAFACAIGFAMLGVWNGKLSWSNKDEYTEMFHEDVYPGSVAHDVIAWNDDRQLSIDKIVAKLRGEDTE